LTDGAGAVLLTDGARFGRDADLSPRRRRSAAPAPIRHAVTS
jgi:hypothetical protein